jgi:hypothetical protein
VFFVAVAAEELLSAFTTQNMRLTIITTTAKLYTTASSALG